MKGEISSSRTHSEGSRTGVSRQKAHIHRLRDAAFRVDTIRHPFESPRRSLTHFRSRRLAQVGRPADIQPGFSGGRGGQPMIQVWRGWETGRRWGTTMRLEGVRGSIEWPGGYRVEWERLRGNLSDMVSAGYAARFCSKVVEIGRRAEITPFSTICMVMSHRLSQFAHMGLGGLKPLSREFRSKVRLSQSSCVNV